MAITVTELARKLEAEKLSATTVDSLIAYIDQSRSSEWDRVKEHFGSKAEVISAFNKLDVRLAKIEERLDSHDREFLTIAKYFEVLEQRMDRFEQRMDRFEQRMEQLSVEQNKNFKTLLITQITILATILGSLVGLLVALK